MGHAAFAYETYAGDYSSIVEPDIILPSELLGLNKCQLRGGERKLMAAILSDGVEAYLTYCTSENPDKNLADICEWVHRRNSSYVFSFDMVCDSLGIDPEYLRLGLARYLADYNRKKSLGTAPKQAWKRIRRPRGKRP